RLFDGSNPKVKFVQTDEEVGNTLKTLLPPDAAISPSGKDFGFVHRSTEDAEIYFVANTSNEKKKTEISFRAAAPQAEVWDAMNGQSSLASVKSQTADATTIALDFEPYQSHVLIFSKTKKPIAILQSAGKIVLTDDLSADWKVTIGKNAPIIMNQLRSWTDDEPTRYFSGTATYEKSIVVPEGLLKKGNSVQLDFGEGKPLEVQPTRNGMQTWLDAPIREAAVIYINDRKVGSLWCPPYKLDITSFLRKGENKIRIVVANTALNYMSGRKLPDYKLLNLRYGERFQAQEMDKIQPISSGLFGTVKLNSIAEK
ncbi:MAG: glycosyl hydrolase, partial [Actinomycetota bacterium]